MATHGPEASGRRSGRPGPPGPHDVGLRGPGRSSRTVFAARAIPIAGQGTLCRSGWTLAGVGVSGCAGPARYEIRVAGVLDSGWAAWFDGLQLNGQAEETVICGLLADQAALHGLLTKVRDLGLYLISVRRLDTGQAGR